MWTTTPWTLAANIAAAVGPDMAYVRVRQGHESYWVGRGTLKQAIFGPFEVAEEKRGADLVGWRYRGPYDDLPAVQRVFQEAGYEHRVVPWSEVGEEEGIPLGTAKTRIRTALLRLRAALLDEVPHR